MGWQVLLGGGAGGLLVALGVGVTVWASFVCEDSDCDGDEFSFDWRC